MIIQKIKNRIYHLYNNHTAKRVHDEHCRLHAEMYKRYNNIIERYRSSGGLKHDFQAYKLFSLAELLDKEKPLSIVELGTGSTTAVFAEYVRHKDNAYLTCVDESEKWLKNNKELAGVSDIESRVDFIHAPKIVSEDCSPVEISYNTKLEEFYDFIFIDGPSLRVNDIKVKGAINGNIFDIAGVKKPKMIVVDIRTATVEEIVNRLGDYYDVQISDVISGDVKKDYRYFSIFRLKNETVENQ